MKEEREILSGIDAPLKKRQGGHNGPPPPGKLGLMHGAFSLSHLFSAFIGTVEPGKLSQ